MRARECTDPDSSRAPLEEWCTKRDDPLRGFVAANRQQRLVAKKPVMFHIMIPFISPCCAGIELSASGWRRWLS